MQHCVHACSQQLPQHVPSHYGAATTSGSTCIGPLELEAGGATWVWVIASPKDPLPVGLLWAGVDGPCCHALRVNLANTVCRVAGVRFNRNRVFLRYVVGGDIAA
jgi:hypothetical protein